MIAPWRSPLARALHRNRSLVYARYAQLATVQPNGRPANRTVVFRGFWPDTNQLQFISDRRSAKVEQIHQNPWGELCWYFPKTREQFRMAGSLHLVMDTHPDPVQQTARRQRWHDLSDAARTQFAWADPGQPRDPEDAFSPAPPDPTQPLPNFCLLLLDPEQVDHLELRGDPQTRQIYRHHESGWTRQAVNP
jgi:pyridoxamine 5'-phosphate oxidase